LAAQVVKENEPLLTYSRLSKIFPMGPPEERINLLVKIGNIGE